MGNEENEDKGKGFVIKDRRHFTEEGEAREKEGPKRQAEQPEAGTPGKTEDESAAKKQEAGQAPLPEINFSTFIFSLNASVLLHLGEYPDPATGKKEVDLPLAKQTIDLIGMLEEKTRGNLTADEENLIKTILYDLRLRYVQKTR
jgi:hypothetical protein